MGVRGWWHRITAPEEQLQSEELQQESSAAGARSLASCQDRERVRVRGKIASVTMHPREGSPTLVAELEDGSGTLRVVWMGRRSIPGIETGRTLTVQGRIVLAEGERVMYNPVYELSSPV